MNFIKNIFKNKKMAISVLSIFFAFCFVALCLTIDSKNAVAEKVDIPNSIIYDNYSLGESVELPSSIEVEYKGETVVASNGYVVLPDNTAVYTGRIVLSKLGSYTVNYLFDYQGEMHVAQKKFEVTDRLYGLSTDNGSIVAVTKEEQQDKTYTNVNDDVLLTKQDGLIVRLADKNVFNYTPSIDLTDVGEDGLCDLITLDYNLSSFALNPDYVEGKTPSWKKYYPTGESAKYCVIRLTDSYDESNYVELYLYADFPLVPGVYPDVYNSEYDFLSTTSQSWYRGIFTARAVGQKRTGAVSWINSYSEWGGFKKINVNGADYGVYVDNRFGTHSNLSFSQVSTAEHLPYTWQYDYKTNNVYVKVNNKSVLVTSLSNSDLYGSSVFTGFSMDKVKLSIYMSEYMFDNKGRVDVMAIGDKSGKELVESFDKNGFIDDVARPEILFDMNLTDDLGVYAPIGSKFSVPSISVIGGDNAQPYMVNAYLNYGSELQLDVPIVDGYINIDKNAQYTIKYVAKNVLGVSGENLLRVNAVDTQKAITLNTEYGFTDIYAGDNQLYLPEYSIDTINRKEDVQVQIEAVHEKETVIIDAQTRKFVPSYSGEYKIIYTISDNVFTVTEEVALNCKPSDKVGFSSAIQVPRYLIKDAEYSFESVSAYSFMTGEPKDIPVKAFISFDGGEFRAISDIKKVKIEGSKDAVLKFTCGQGDNTAQLVSEKIEIVDVNYASKTNLFIQNYFVHEGFDFIPFDINTNFTFDVRYQSKINQGNNMLKFINALDVSNLRFDFKITKEHAKFKSVKVVLTDSVDAQKTVVLEFIDADPWCAVTINGQNRTRTNVNFADNATKTFGYNAKLRKLTLLDSTFDIDLDEYLPSGKCYLDVELCDIYDEASIVIANVNGQSIMQDFYGVKDVTAPLITIRDFSGEYLVGETLDISIPRVTDVLSPITKSNVSIVVYKNDEIIKATNGVLMDGTANAFNEYQIRLDAYGEYKVIYKIADGFGNSFSKTCFVKVVDSSAPVIKFVKNYGGELTCKVGEVIDLSVAVSDDKSSIENIKTDVLFKDVYAGAYYSIENYKVKFSYAGKFEAYVTAQDEVGNFSYIKLEINVVEEGGV